MNRIFAVAGTLALASIAFAIPALAQDAGTRIGLGPWVDLIVAVLTPTITAVVGGFVVWGVTWIARKAHVDISANDREALNTAIQNGVNAALLRLRTAAQPITLNLKNQIIAQAVNHAALGVPDAIKRLQPTAEQLARIAEAKLNQALTLDDAPPQQPAATDAANPTPAASNSANA